MYKYAHRVTQSSAVMWRGRLTRRASAPASIDIIISFFISILHLHHLALIQKPETNPTCRTTSVSHILHKQKYNLYRIYIPRRTHLFIISIPK